MPIFVTAIAERGSIDEHTVQQLRFMYLEKRRLERNDVEVLLALDRSVQTKASSWDNLLADAFVRNLVAQSNDGIVERDAGRWFANCIEKQGVVDNYRLFSCLKAVLDQAKLVPGFLRQLALKQVCHAVLHGIGPLAEHRNGSASAIDNQDVRLIRDLLFGSDNLRGSPISFLEVECLFDLNDRVFQTENDEAWPDLLVEAVEAHVADRLKRRCETTGDSAAAETSAESGDLWENLAVVLRSVSEVAEPLQQRLRTWINADSAEQKRERELSGSIAGKSTLSSAEFPKLIGTEVA